MSAISQLGTLGDVLDYLVERGLKASEADHLVKLVLEFGIGAAKARKPRSPSTKPAKIKRRIPDDFVFNDQLAGIASSRGFERHDAETMFDAFTNYYQASGKAWSDWPAVWRMWIDRTVERKNGEAQRSPLI